jgi:hypothetical protein
MTYQNNPREPRQFPDMSDNQDGYGNTKWDIEETFGRYNYPDEEDLDPMEQEDMPVNSLGEQD